MYLKLKKLGGALFPSRGTCPVIDDPRFNLLLFEFYVLNCQFVYRRRQITFKSKKVVGQIMRISIIDINQLLMSDQGAAYIKVEMGYNINFILWILVCNN